jgi:photosystem II stability/assembly factor-like uncharacterized protein
MKSVPWCFLLIAMLVAGSTFAQPGGWNTEASGTRPTLNEVFFSDLLTGIAVGASGTVLRTRGGGTIWEGLVSGTLNTLTSATLINTGFANGFGEIILRTTNGGGTWVPFLSGTTLSLSGASFPQKNIGTIVGESGTILRTTDGGGQLDQAEQRDLGQCYRVVTR